MTFMRKELGLLHQISIVPYPIYRNDSVETLSIDVILGFIFTVDSGSIIFFFVFVLFFRQL